MLHFITAVAKFALAEITRLRQAGGLWFNLIAVGTIDEKILRLHQNKRSMADALLQDADLFNQISADDVMRLLREAVDNV